MFKYMLLYMRRGGNKTRDQLTGINVMLRGYHSSIITVEHRILDAGTGSPYHERTKLGRHIIKQRGLHVIT